MLDGAHGDSDDRGRYLHPKMPFLQHFEWRPRALDSNEPTRVAESIKALGLRYAVITSVDRDDLDDYGAAHWVQTIKEIQRLNPETKVELLIP